jgi:hypothetical protein
VQSLTGSCNVEMHFLHEITKVLKNLKDMPVYDTILCIACMRAVRRNSQS